MSPSSLLLGLVLALAPIATALADAPAASGAQAAGFSPDASRPLSLPQYMGRWYVIGRVPNPVERGHVASINEYRLDEDNKVQIHYHFREGLDGAPQTLALRASTQADSGHRRWRTWFYKVIPTRTDVLEVAEDYSWALIGYPGRDMAWIMARDPSMDTATYRRLLERLADYGYNTDRMRRVVHDPSQAGQLGFETPRP